MASSRTPNGPPMYKNKLQEYTQKSELPLPVYHNVNEGFTHAPKFRSSVVIDGKTFTSSRTFHDRRSAEQDVARTAYECVTTNSRNEDRVLVRQACQNPRLNFGLKPIFCKSILHEYAFKVNLGIPIYNTTYAQGTRPTFISSFQLGGKTYKGEEAKSTKEAEQLVARNAIQSLLRSDNTGRLAEIVKSKERIYSLSQAKNQQSNSTMPLTYQPNLDESSRRPEANIQTEINGYDCDLGRVIDPRRGVKRKFEIDNLQYKKNNV